MKPGPAMSTDRTGGNAKGDQQRDARTINEPAQDVAAVVVGPEKMVGAGLDERTSSPEHVGTVGGQHWREQSGSDHNQQ